MGDATIEVEMFDEAHLRGSLLLVALPTAGAVTAITSRYLRNQLDLPLVGHLRVRPHMGIVAIDNGRATSPIRLYGRDMVCGVDGECTAFYMIASDLPIPPPMQTQVADAVAKWADEQGVAMVLSLEGVVRDADDDEPDVYCVANSVGALDRLKSTGVKPLQEGVLVGVTAHLLQHVEVSCGALVVEASGAHPDGHAAAALIAAFDKMTPEFQVDLAPLREQADTLQKQLEEHARAAARQAPAEHSFI